MRARQAVFDWLAEQTTSGKYVLTREELTDFTFEGERLPLLDTGRGIRNPAQFSSTLTVMTSFDSPYADEEVVGGLFKYHYQKDNGGDNIKLQTAAATGTPIAYFKGIHPKTFVPFWPVYVFDSPEDRTVLLAIGDDMRLMDRAGPMGSPARAYAERMVHQRLHQPQFRANVLFAYEARCAICRLAHAELLDAAHILPDSTEAGVPFTSNGIALCKIHHAAFDRDMIGISPDYEVRVRDSLLGEKDGPMLKYGIQEMHGVRLRVPTRPREQPNRDALSERYHAFQSKV